MSSNTSSTIHTCRSGNIMTNSFTDRVYFSELLPQRCPILYQHLAQELTVNNICHFLLKNTKDIWCRDYMPIQIDEKRFVCYIYNPDYLQTKYYLRTITDVRNMEYFINLQQECEIFSLDLVIDGGNVVKCGDKIVMTDKVFEENSAKSHLDILNMLENAFLSEIIILPWDNDEYLGHSDGIVHYVGDNRILITNYWDFNPTLAKKYLKILEQHFDVLPLSYNVKRNHQRSWAYVNYLQIGDFVFVPQLGIAEDEQALQQIVTIYPNCKVIGIPAIEAVRKGGALNCISWNIVSREME